MSVLFILYHSPRCSKSCSAFDLLQERDTETGVVRCLDMPPDLTILQSIFRELGLESAHGVIRMKDSLYQKLGLDNPDLDNSALLRVAAEYPALLEHPILVTPDKAAISRPLKNIEAPFPE